MARKKAVQKGTIIKKVNGIEVKQTKGGSFFIRSNANDKWKRVTKNQGEKYFAQTSKGTFAKDGTTEGTEIRKLNYKLRPDFTLIAIKQTKGGAFFVKSKETQVWERVSKGFAYNLWQI